MSFKSNKASLKAKASSSSFHRESPLSINSFLSKSPLDKARAGCARWRCCYGIRLLLLLELLPPGFGCACGEGRDDPEAKAKGSTCWIVVNRLGLSLLTGPPAGDACTIKLFGGEGFSSPYNSAGEDRVSSRIAPKPKPTPPPAITPFPGLKGLLPA